VTARSLLRSLVPVLLLLGCGLAPDRRSAPPAAIGTLAPLASPAAARPGFTPVASQGADLAWISLIPTDLSQPRYGQTLAMVFTAAQYANAAAPGRSEATTESLAKELQDAGWQRAYLSALQLQSATAPNPHDRVIESLVSQCSDEASASRSFALLQKAMIDYRGMEPEALPMPIGDDALLLRKHFTNILGGPADQLRLLVRDGSIVLDLQITDWTKTTPPAWEALQLIRVLQNRLREVLAGTTPGLSAAVYRLDPQKVTQHWDGYRRRNNVQMSFYYQQSGDVSRVKRFADMDTPFAEMDRRYHDLGVIDLYRYAASWDVYSATRLGLMQYQVDILRFATDTEAAAPLSELARQELAKAGPNLQDVTEVTDVPPLGDESLVMTYTLHHMLGTPDPGYAVWIRVGDRVAAVYLMGPRASLAMLEQVAQDQVVCLTTAGCWEGTATLRSNS
jgi:hypothetical protein